MGEYGKNRGEIFQINKLIQEWRGEVVLFMALAEKMIELEGKHGAPKLKKRYIATFTKEHTDILDAQLMRIRSAENKIKRLGGKVPGD